jgi:hypothetical protein
MIVFVMPGQTRASDFPVLTGPYLGQEPPGIEPEVFAPGIVSSEKYNEYICIFSPGATECVFDRWGEEEFADGAVLTTRLEDGGWIEPEIHELFAEYSAFQPTVSPDGKRWFFMSRTLPVPAGVRGVLPMFYIDRAEEGWTEPVYFAQGIHASATLDGTVYYDGASSDGRSHPAFSTPVEGGYSRPQFVGEKVFSTSDDVHGVVSPDGNCLIFDSDERPRVGECLLFVSFREPDGTWTEPVSMGKAIQRRAAIAWFTFDGKYIFFKADGDIYWVSTEILERFKPEPGLRTQD